MATEENLDKFENIPKLIPELSYDLISRVIPGSIVVGSMLWLFEVDTNKDNINIFVGLFCILLAYTIGFIFDAVTTFFGGRMMIRCSWNTILKLFDNDVDKLIRNIGDPLGFKEKDDLINHRKIFLERLRERVVTNYPYATSMMPKLTAETGLPKNLLLSLFVVALLAVFFKHYNLVHRDIDKLYPLIYLLIVIELFIFIVAWHRLKRVVERTVYWFGELQKMKTERHSNGEIKNKVDKKLNKG